VCSQGCTNRAPGFECQCVAGYQLDADRLHCAASQSKTESCLVYALGKNLFRVPLNYSGKPPSLVPTPVLFYQSKSAISSLGTYVHLTSVLFCLTAAALAHDAWNITDLI